MRATPPRLTGGFAGGLVGRWLTEVTGLIPVEYPTTRQAGATPQAHAADINAAFADPVIRAILAVVGGEDQITVIPHVDAALAGLPLTTRNRAPGAGVGYARARGTGGVASACARRSAAPSAIGCR